MNAARGDPDWSPLQPIIVKRHDALADTSLSSRQLECRINSVSELEAQADSRIDRGSLQEAVCETIGYLRPHDACISVEALRKSIIRDEGNRIELSAALRQAGIPAMRGVQGGRRPALETVLLFVVIGKT
jgi:hypothetical protein